VQTRRQNRICSLCALFVHLFFRFLEWKCVAKSAAVRAGLGKVWLSKKFQPTRSDPLCQLRTFLFAVLVRQQDAGENIWTCEE
jgi:hypothetical protein